MLLFLSKQSDCLKKNCCFFFAACGSVSDPTNFYNEDDFDIGKQICIAGKIPFTSLQNQMAMKFLRNSQLIFEEL